jgi:2-dehydropantoate 2-reductase
MASSAERSTSKERPPWLGQLLSDTRPPPTLYAWNPDNIGVKGYANVRSGTPQNCEERIYILGIGNLGRLFANALDKLPDPPPITLVVHRQELLSAWTRGEVGGIGIVRDGVLEENKNFDIEMWSETPPHAGPVREVADGGKLRNLLITTKASVAVQQADRARKYLDASSSVAFAQNGMSKFWPPSGPEYVSARFDEGAAPNILACITTHGVTSLGTFKSRHASQADVAVGSVMLNQRCPSGPEYMIQALTTAPHLDARVVARSDLWVLQLEKLVVNAIINPLTALLRCKNGVLFEESRGVYTDVMDQLLQETSAVLQALINHDSNRELVDSWEGGSAETSSSTVGGFTDDRHAQLAERLSTSKLREMLYRVGYKVAENRSSMLQDVEAHKQTEIRDFNGWIIDTAMSLDPALDVSGHRKLIQLVESGATLDKIGLEGSFLR